MSSISNNTGIYGEEPNKPIKRSSKLKKSKGKGAVKAKSFNGWNKGPNLASSIKIFADENRAAASKSQFNQYLGQMKTLEPKDFVRFMRAFDRDESLVELICDETGSKKEDRKAACREVMDTLAQKAKEAGINIGNIRNEFNKELDKQFDSWGFVNTKKMDAMINQVVSQMEGQVNLSNREKKTQRKVKSADGQIQANRMLQSKLENAYAAFGERVTENGKMSTQDKFGNNYKGQMQKDGWAANFADWVSGLWGSKNRASVVRKDLKASASQLKELEEARKNGNYAEKFEEIFKVPYDYKNIAAYEKAERAYVQTKNAEKAEINFQEKCKNLLKNKPLQSEYLGLVSEKSVYEREYKKLASSIENGEQVLENLMEKHGVKNGTLSQKYEVLKIAANNVLNNLSNKTLLVSNGKSLEEIEERHQNAYIAAYGNDNDIMKRVNDYNISQQIGEATVEGVVVGSAALGTSFMPLAVGTRAAIVAGTAAATGISNTLTRGSARQALKAEGFSKFIETANKDTNWREFTENVVVSGSSVLVSGALSSGVSASLGKTTNATEALAEFGGNILVDTVQGELTEGMISTNNTAYSVLLDDKGHIVAIKPTQQEKQNSGENVKLTTSDSATVAEEAKKRQKNLYQKITDESIDRLSKRGLNADMIMTVAACKGAKIALPDYQIVKYAEDGLSYEQIEGIASLKKQGFKFNDKNISIIKNWPDELVDSGIGLATSYKNANLGLSDGEILMLVEQGVELSALERLIQNTQLSAKHLAPLLATGTNVYKIQELFYSGMSYSRMLETTGAKKRTI